MLPWIIVIAVVAVNVAGLLVGLRFTYKTAFYSDPNKRSDPYRRLPADSTDPEIIRRRALVDEISTLDAERVYITSRDGLRLSARYYHVCDGAPTEILCHGYRSMHQRDFSGIHEIGKSLGHNLLMIDQRAHGESEGVTITFGIKERLDCLDWINYCVARFGEDTKIIITGVSMGAATVIMAAAEDLPRQVVCALADCGYTSAKEIIRKVITEMRLPAGLAYPFVRLGARLFGGFDLEETSPLEAVREAKIPIIFIHGDTDDFVPCYMSEKMYGECVSQKAMKIIHGAGHGLAFPIDKEGYLSALRDFQTQLL